MIEEARIKSGAQQYRGHDIMDLARFDENTKHMTVFDIHNECCFGFEKGRNRLFLTEEGYKIAMGEADRVTSKFRNMPRYPRDICVMTEKTRCFEKGA